MKRAKSKDRKRGAGRGVSPGAAQPGRDAQLIATLDLLEQRRAPYAELLAHIVQRTLVSYPALPVGPIVEVGAGTGQLSAWLSPEDASRLILTDPSPAALQAVRRERQPILVAAAENLPFADASLAAVLGLCVFDAVNDETAAVREIARVLAPGGRFIHFLDMATLLERPFAQLASAAMVPIPNLFSDPAEHAWPLDIVLLPVDWIQGILALTRQTAHPFYRAFSAYFELFTAPAFRAAHATELFKAIASNSERRHALLALLGSAGQLALNAGYPPPKALPFHSARYLLSVLDSSFTASGAFRVERAEIVSDSVWRDRPPGDPVAYRSLCLGHQRISDELPTHLLDTKVDRDGSLKAGTAKVLVEAGMFIFVAQRL